MAAVINTVVLFVVTAAAIIIIIITKINNRDENIKGRKQNIKAKEKIKKNFIGLASLYIIK
jgi:hypothetical protein